MPEGEFTIEIKSWKGLAGIAAIVCLAFCIHHFTYYYNPNLDASIEALASDDPTTISQALLDADTLGMEKGHKLVPHILFLLGDERPVPEPILQKMIQKIQATPGAIIGVDANLKSIYTIGFSAAMTLQSLIINDLHRLQWISGRTKSRIITHVTQTVDPDDEYALANALAAVRMMRDKRLLQFWFDCLAIESETIRIHALAGIRYYIHDRTNGFFIWHPEKEISAEMIENLTLCLNDPSAFIQRKARDIQKHIGFYF